MSPAIILATLVALLIVAIFAIILWGIVRSNRTWIASFAGHQIVLENRAAGEKLYIDGAVVDQRSGMLDVNTNLRGQILRPDGGFHVVEGKIRQGTLGASIKGYIFVDGMFVGGDPI